MPITQFVDTKVISVKSTDTVNDVIEIFEKHNLRWVPVLDEKGCYLGAFHTHLLIKALIPNAFTMEGTSFTHANFMSQTPEKMKSILKKASKKPVSEYMDVDYPCVYEDESGTEGLFMMYRKGSPLPVLKEGTKELVGFISHQTAIRKIKSLIQDTPKKKDQKQA